VGDRKKRNRVKMDKSSLPVSVTHYYREPRNTGVSIEGIFNSVKENLKGRAQIKDYYVDPSLSRWQNIRKAASGASDINHITGDVNFLAIGLKGRKNILTIHDFGFYENPIHSRLKHMFYHLFWFYFPLKHINIVTVVSEFTKEKLIKYFNFPENRIRVITDPVKAVFRHTPKAALNAVPVVLMLGTGKHKNLDNLIDASKGLNIHLDIVGWPAPDELAKLKEYNIPHTVYNRLTDEQVYERYVACDILYIASHYEGFGMPIIEEQAVGRPVITSNIGAMLEVGKGSAILVSPTVPAETSTAISELISDRLYYNATVELGLKNAAKYDHKKVAEQYLEVYKELAAQKK
jgi:glycosyltransferase involved in cell wall biosynthesis